MNVRHTNYLHGGADIYTNMADVETLKEVIQGVRESFSGVRSGYIDGGPEVAFSTNHDDPQRIEQTKADVKRYIQSTYGVRVQEVNPRDVTSATGRAAPDFAFKLQ